MPNLPIGIEGGGFAGGSPGWMSGVLAAPQSPDPMSLLQMAQTAMGTGDNPYGGRTLGDIVLGGEPGGMNAPGFHGTGQQDARAFAADWSKQPATHQGVSAAIARGGRYQPDIAKTLQSSGEEGGWFSIPGIGPAGQAQGNVPWGYYPSPDGGPDPNPAPGLAAMSTNNWRLLPKQFRDPQYAMRAGHIIERRWADNPTGYVRQHGSDVQGPTASLGGPGYGSPYSFGNSATRAYFWPGQLEPWQGEGGAGTY